MNSLLAQAAAGAPSAGLLANPMVFMILLFAIFYFIAIRPQQRREKERKAQIALRAGQVILFCGGMVGVVEEVREKTFVVRTANTTLVEIARGAVERTLPAASSPAEAAPNS